MGEVEREARVPAATVLGRLAGEIDRVLDVGAEAGGAHHRATAAAQALLPPLLPHVGLKLDVEQAESNYGRIKTALDATEILAEKAGFMIYGENPYNGKKIFPGETHYSGFEIAQIASREDLQIRFWVHEADIREVGEGDAIDVPFHRRLRPAGDGAAGIDHPPRGEHVWIRRERDEHGHLDSPRFPFWFGRPLLA